MSRILGRDGADANLPLQISSFFPRFGILGVLTVEFAFEAAIFLLRDVFSSWTLWYLPPTIIQILRQFDLTTSGLGRGGRP